MISLDDAFLDDLQLGFLPVAQKNALLAAIYEESEIRVGMRIASAMDDSQLDEFEAFIDADDEAGALTWLETNYPDYRDVVQEEFEALRAELRSSTTEIRSAAIAYLA